MAKSKRECPALGQSISSARCGEERGVVIACPPDCAYNPFAPVNYEHLPDLERRLFEKTLHRFDETFGERGASGFRDDMRRTANYPLVQQAIIQRRFYRDHDSTGLTLAERWAQDRWRGLNQDERRLFQCQAGTRLALLETHRQIDDQSVEAVDLLDPDQKRLVLVDRGFAEVWVRFGTYLTWVYDAPHFPRVCGLLLEFFQLGTRELEEWFPIILSFLGGPAEIHGARDWLTENLERFLKCQEASATALSAAMLDRLDGRFGRARYRWQHPSAPANLRSRLAAALDVEPGELSQNDLDDGWDESWILIDRAATTATETSVPLLGWILAGPSGVLLKAPSEAQFTKLKHRFEEMAGDDVAFDAERIDDLPSQLRASGKFNFDASLVPPQLLENGSELTVSTSIVSADSPDMREEATTDFFQQLYKNFADHPLPALENKTPRQAATDPALRPALVRLMKGHVRTLDREALRRGTIQDINWLIRDLGLNEIELPPPPLRTPPENEWNEDDEDDYGDDAKGIDFTFTSTPSDRDWHSHPAPPGRILDELDLANRLNSLQSAVTTANITSRMDETSRAWPGLKELMLYARHHFYATESALLALHVWQLVNVLHPSPPPGARINLDRWRHFFDEECEYMATVASQDLDDAGFDSLTLNMPQPSVASWLAVTVIDNIDLNRRRPLSRRRDRPSFRLPEGIMALGFLRALLRELCHWPIK